MTVLRMITREICVTVKMRVTYDDLYLVTISEDSTIMMWKIQDREGRTLKREKDVGWAEEILITKSDLEEKVTANLRCFNLLSLCCVIM